MSIEVAALVFKMPGVVKSISRATETHTDPDLSSLTYRLHAFVTKV